MNVVHIATREFRSTFSTAIGWLIAAGFFTLTGFFWTAMVQAYVVQGEDLVFDPYGASQLNLTDWLLTPFFGNVAVVLMLLIPGLSMRMYAEEIKQRTLELLLTSPVSTLEIVVGKWVGALWVVAVLLAGTMVGPLVLYGFATPDPGVIAGGYLGLFALAASLLAMGGFASSFTANQVVALVLSFAAALGLLVLSWLSRDPTDLWAQISIISHLDGLMKGEVKLSDLVYFGAFTFVFLFATHQRMESFRWN
ncbi:MAG: ABC transporter permease subunit [Myxococcota bacterium]